MPMRFSTLILLLATAAGAEEPLHQHFEDRVPGERPSGWRHAWGDKADDLLIVSNLQSAAGRQALLLDRAENTAQWGAQTGLPTIDHGWLALSFAFRVEGKGDRAHFGIELRNGTTRALAMSFRFSHLTVVTKLPKAPKEWKGGSLGSYRESKWYRVRLWLPSRSLPQAIARAQLESATATNWEAVDPAVPVACELAQRPSPLLMLCLSPGRTGFRLYLDELVCSREAPAQGADDR